jgi:hypothetical protein
VQHLLLGDADLRDDLTCKVERGNVMWDVGAIAGASELGFGFGLLAGVGLADATRSDSGAMFAVGAVGALVGGLAGYFLGESARDGSIAARVLVIVVNVLATAATVTAIGLVGVELSSLSSFSFPAL